MMKLYKAKYELNVVFFSEHEDEYELRAEAQKWAIKNGGDCGTGIINISELKSLDDLPEGWNGLCTPWGGEDHTVDYWFRNLVPRLAKIDNLKAEIAILTEELNSLTGPQYG